MFPLLTNTHLFTLIVLLLAFLSISFFAYRKKIEIEEIEEKLKKYREKTKTTLEMKEIGPRGEGSYYREENKIEMVSTFPHPLEGYETPAMQRVKTHYKEKWEELKEILLSAIKNPYLSPTEKEELLSRLDELEIEIMKGKNLPEEEKLKLISLYKLDYLLDNLGNCLYPPLGRDDIKKAVEWLQKMAKFSIEYQKYLPSELKDLPANVEKLINEFLLLSLRSDSPIPYKDLKPLLNKIDEISNRVYNLKIREGLFSYMITLGREMKKIRSFLEASPENKLKDILDHIHTEAHETAHAILDNYFLKKLEKNERERFYSLEELRALDEGFADAFQFYFIAKEIEKGYLPFDALRQAAKDEKETLAGKKPKVYAIGGMIFELNDIAKEIESIEVAKLSPLEIKEKVRDIRKRLSRRIEYVIGIIKNSSIPFDRKIQIFLEMERKSIKNLYES
jgi:hypothetical protein